MTEEAIKPEEAPQPEPTPEEAALKAAAEAGALVNGEPVIDPSASAEGEPSDIPERPEDVPEKFWDAEKGEVRVDAILAANKELEKQFTQSRQGKSKEGEEGGSESSEGANNPVTAANAEWAEKGELSDDTYASLEKAGLSREMVDGYIAGEQAKQDLAYQQAYSLAGGTKESYESMVEWASTNLSPEEITSFNTQLANSETQNYAISQLYSKFQAEAPKEPTPLGGQSSNQPTGGHYKSSAEMQKDMSDPRYQTDAAFRELVAKKIQGAERANINLFT